MAVYLSGAGGNNSDKACFSSKWGPSNSYGFVLNTIKDDKLYARYFYTYDKKNFEFWDAPIYDFTRSTIEEKEYAPNKENNLSDLASED